MSQALQSTRDDAIIGLSNIVVELIYSLLESEKIVVTVEVVADGGVLGVTSSGVHTFFDCVNNVLDHGRLTNDTG